jgi:hypothetical protein
MTLLQIANKRINELRQEYKRIQSIEIQGEKNSDEYGKNMIERRNLLKEISKRITQEEFDRNILFYARQAKGLKVDFSDLE